MSSRKWDAYYEKQEDNNVMWFSKSDIDRIALRYKIDRRLAEFVWYRTEHSVRTYELMQIKDNYNILEVGCGTGAFTAGMILGNKGKKIEVVAIDYSPVVVEKAIRKFKNLGLENECQFRIADATNLPFPDNTFDIVVVPSVIEHIPYQEKAIIQFARVCKKGGRVIISTDNKYGRISVLGFHTFIALVGRFLRRLGALEKDHIYYISNTPLGFKNKIKKARLELEIFEFTHFSLPLLRHILNLLKYLPKAFQFSLYRILCRIEELSRKSQLGILHPMYIVVCRKS